jgi:hypothetical protein
MPPKKSPSVLPGQLSFAHELFSAKPPAQEVIEAGSSLSEPTTALLPSTPNSFGYALHILQDPTIFKRALVWKVVGRLLGGGGACYLCKALIDAF